MAARIVIFLNLTVACVIMLLTFMDQDSTPTATAENPLVDVSELPSGPDDLTPAWFVPECHKTALRAAQAVMPADLGIEWRWVELPDGVAGVAYSESRVVGLSPDTDCSHMATTALHEWYHVADEQDGGQPDGSYRGVPIHEMHADCGAHRLAESLPVGYEPVTPYASEVGGCTADHLAAAENTINQY